MKIGILRNEDEDSVSKWVIACQKKNISYTVIDITASDWLGKVTETKFDFFLLRPSGMSEHFKKLYDERIYIISKVLNYKTFPSYEECYIYENKKLLSDYLTALDLPHPKTKVFYSKKEALNFISKTNFPLVSKTSIGASGSGVKIIKDHKQAQKYILKAFSSKGIRRKFGPNTAVGTPKIWLNKALKSPAFFVKKIKHYFKIYKNIERDYVIFQEYVPHNFEWRAVRIGDSYFAHKKIKYKEKASGSKGIEYLKPPVSILNFTRDICDKLNYNFMAIDIFEDGHGGYLINELQTIFGHVQEYILAVDGKTGRYVYRDNEWIFEEGEFNTNESYDLRLETAIQLFQSQKKESKN